jgi:hypothetical protein
MIRKERKNVLRERCHILDVTAGDTYGNYWVLRAKSKVIPVLN